MMNHAPRPLPLLALLLTLLAGHAGFAADAERPVFQQRLQGSIYQTRFEQVLADGPTLAELEASTMPLAGQLVYKVLPGMQGERLGMTPGDVLVRIDNTRLWDYTLLNPARKPHPQTIELCSSEGERRLVQVMPGRIGFWHTDYLRPDLKYIRDGQRNPAYDQELIVAIRAGRSDPALAETALWHALRKGYGPDEFSDALGAVIALYAGRPAEADAYARRVPLPDADHPHRPNAQLRARIAMTLGDYEQLLELAHRNPERALQPEDAQTLLALWRRQGAEPPPSPGSLAQGWQRVPLDPRQVGPIDDAPLIGATYGPELEFGNPLDFTFGGPPGSPGRSYSGVYKPTRDVELVMRFRVTAPPRELQWSNILEILLLDWQYRRRHGIDSEGFNGLQLRKMQTLVGLSVERGPFGETLLRVGGAGKPDALIYSEPTISLEEADPSELEIRLTRVGSWGQVTVNGMPVATLPVEVEARYPAVMLFFVGTQTTAEQIQLFRLVPPEGLPARDQARPAEQE